MDTLTRTVSASRGAFGGRGPRGPGSCLHTATARLVSAFRGPRATAPYGWNRILAAAQRLEEQERGWWRADATPAVDVATLDVASWVTCVAAQLAGGEASGQLQGTARFAAGLRRFGITTAEAPRLALAGVDADRFTSGWRLLITLLRGGATLDELAGLA